MKNKKSDPPVTRSEFLKETESIRKGMATKEGLNKLDDKVNRLAGEIVKIHSDLKTKATKEDLNNTESRILNAIDAFAQKAENYDRKAVFHDSRINDHEERITQLEKTVSK